MDKDGNSVGRGWSIPSPPVKRSEWDPAVTYLEAASRPPQRVVSSTELAQCDVQIKMAAQEKEKEAAQATLERIHRQEVQEGGLPAERDSQQCLSSPQLEGCNVSNVSMIDESLQQHDSNVVVEEGDESMETDEPADSGSPAVLLEEGFPEGPEAEADEDQDSHTMEESTDQNPPHNSDLDEDDLLGPLADVSVPGGHSDDSVALVVSLGDDDL